MHQSIVLGKNETTLIRVHTLSLFYPETRRRRHNTIRCKRGRVAEWRDDENKICNNTVVPVGGGKTESGVRGSRLNIFPRGPAQICNSNLSFLFGPRVIQSPGKVSNIKKITENKY